MPDVMRILQCLVLIQLCLALPFASHSQLRVDTSYSARVLVDSVLLGKRVEVRKVVYAGPKVSFGWFRDSSETPLISEGIIMSTGRVRDAIGPNIRANTSYNTGGRNDRGLEAIARGPTFDAAYLEFDFKPEMEVLLFNFVFASEEYTEYVNTQFNDVFAFFISGPGIEGTQNLAVIPRNRAPITVNTVNHIYNRSNYIDNNHFDRKGKVREDKLENMYPDLLEIYEYDGFTTLLSAEAKVIPGQVYRIRIAIADVSDSRYDSAVLLEAHSFTSLPGDPGARAAILHEEYSHVRRKFAPVRVGEGVFGNETVAGSELPVTTATEPKIAPSWRVMVNFSFDSYALSAEEKTQLDSAWTNVLSRSTKMIVIQGHTDNTGSEGYNQRLSRLRAMTVLDYLRKKGLKDERVDWKGFGFSQPAGDNDTERGRAINRRAEVFLGE